RTVALKLRFADFTTITRSRTLPEPTALGRAIYEEVSAEFDAAVGSGKRVRLVGVRVEQLMPSADGAPALWDDNQAWRDAEQTLDALDARFGRGAVRPAALLRASSPREPEPGAEGSGIFT